MSVIAATTVIRGSQPGTSHGGVYLLGLDRRRGAHLLDWTRPSIDWSGHGGGRGLRGLAFGDDRVLVAGATELFSFAPGFALLGVAVAANGYRACEEHRQYDMARAAGDVGPCDWPMGGLGAAPMAREGER